MPNKKPISDESVKKATGKDWSEWVRVINKLGGKKLTHRETAKLLWEKKAIKSRWWCQIVTVGYKHLTNKRAEAKARQKRQKINQKAKA